MLVSLLNIILMFHIFNEGDTAAVELVDNIIVPYTPATTDVKVGS
jgi:hypothetical protein